MWLKKSVITFSFFSSSFVRSPRRYTYLFDLLLLLCRVFLVPTFMKCRCVDSRHVPTIVLCCCLCTCVWLCFLPVFKCIQACSLTLVVLRCYISHAGSSMGASLYRDNHNRDPEVPVDGHVLWNRWHQYCSGGKRKEVGQEKKVCNTATGLNIIIKAKPGLLHDCSRQTWSMLSSLLNLASFYRALWSYFTLAILVFVRHVIFTFWQESLFPF